MSTNTLINKSRSLVPRSVVIAGIALVVCSQLSLAQPKQQRSFASTSQASQALYNAVKNNDQGALDGILGAGPELTSSGSDAEDKLNRERFLQKYQQMHRLVHESDGTTVLYIGAENWPFPVPLVSKNAKWYFEPDAGAEEILARRIGEDETVVLQVCQAVVAGTRDELKTTNGNPATDYAQHLIAAAAMIGNGIPEQELFHGYYFRTVSDKSGGTTLVAYPAEYRGSGVMTYMVTPSGSVYDKDLGPQTTTLAQSVAGKPTKDWVAVQ
jgi:hypothetical protein